MVRPVTQQPVSNTFPPREVGDSSVPKERISRPSDTFEVANGRAGQRQKEAWSVQDVLDNTQLVLDLAGLVPGVGEVADAANVGISVARGKYIDAALSAVSLIPVAGDAIGKGAKALLRASNTAAAKKAAQQLFKLVSKTDFAAFYKSLERALERVPQFRQQARRVVGEVSRGLDEVMSTLAEKFGLPRPVFATVDGPPPGLNPPPRRPAGSPGATTANAARQALEASARKAIGSRPALEELLNQPRLFEPQTASAVSELFKELPGRKLRNEHLRDHVVPAGDAGVTKLMTELQNRKGLSIFSAFPSLESAKAAAGLVLDTARKNGVDLLNSRALPADLKQLGEGQSLVKNGISYMKKDGRLSATLQTSFETGVEFARENGAVRTEATNGIKLVLSGDGGLTTVFPVKL